MQKHLFIFLLLSSINSAPSFAADSSPDFSANQDYTYDSFKSSSYLSTNRSAGSSVIRRNANTSRGFSGQVMVTRKGGRPSSASDSDYTQPNTYTPTNSNQSSNQAYYRTNPYKY